MKYLLIGLSLFFMLLLVYQLYQQHFPIREGLLASTMESANYKPDSAYQDISDHDKRLTTLESQVKTNTDAISNLQAKVSQTEGFLASQQQPYTEENESTDITSQSNRIHSLQVTVKQTIKDIGTLNTKMHLVPANQYTNLDTQLSLDSSAKISNQQMIVAQEKAISNLETIVKENTDDITELNNQLQQIANKHKQMGDKVIANGSPSISGL
jgi:hypothetical protein